MTCDSSGEFISSTSWSQTCSVPKVCDSVPIPSNDSGLANSTKTSVKAYRSVSYSCKDPTQVIDTGRKYILNCLENGNFETPSWPTCRNPSNCAGPIPMPAEASGLANSTSDLTTMREWDEAIYKCIACNEVVGKLD